MSLPVSTSVDGITITVNKVNKNKVFKCGDCWSKDHCSIKQRSMDKPVKGTLVATEFLISVINATENPLSLSAGYWEMLDNEGFAYGALEICDDFIKAKYVRANHWLMSPATQVRTQLFFPELDDDTKPAALIFSGISGSFLRLDLMKISGQIQELLNTQEDIVRKHKCEKDYELKQIISKVATLKKNVFVRFNNVLTPKEQISMENQIMNLEFEIKEYNRKAEQWKKEFYEEDFQTTMVYYHEQINAVKKSEEQEKKYANKVEELYSLTPREFEEWTGSLFVALGYSNVVLTPLSGDKGIDLLAEKDGKKIAVQCKKFKGVVGSPIIQAFLGAMQTAEIDKGFFITTGTYSVEAEKVAEEMPIELYDKVSLRKLIQQAFNEHDEKR